MSLLDRPWACRLQPDVDCDIPIDESSCDTDQSPTNFWQQSVGPRLTAAIPMVNLYCSCMLTSVALTDLEGKPQRQPEARTRGRFQAVRLSSMLSIRGLRQMAMETVGKGRGD